MDKPNKILALSQDEIDYVAEFAPRSPALIMLGNTTALIRCEIKRINAEFILDEMVNEGIESDALERWRSK